MTLTATFQDTSKTTTLILLSAISAFSVAPTSVLGGVNSDGIVTLSSPAGSSGAVVTISSSNTAIATVQPGVRVAAGKTAASFPIATKAVAVTTPVVIKVSYDGAIQTRTLTVEGKVAGLILTPASVVGGANSDGGVTLASPAGAPRAVVTVVCSNPALVTVQPAVAVAEGTTAGSFPIKTKAVTKTTTVTITVSYAGSSATQTLTLQP